nr:MAG TPA: hypothetical protein [Caudoviricetes sp.]
MSSFLKDFLLKLYPFYILLFLACFKILLISL